MTALITTQSIARIKARDTRVAIREVVYTWSFQESKDGAEMTVLINNRWFVPLDESDVRYMLNTLSDPYIISMVARAAKRNLLRKIKPDMKTLQQVVNLDFATMHERTAFRDSLLSTATVQQLGL